MLGGFQNSMSSNRDAARRRLRGFPVGCGSSDLEVTPAAVACQVIMANFRSLGMQVVVTEPCRTREAGTKGPASSCCWSRLALLRYFTGPQLLTADQAPTAVPRTATTAAAAMRAEPVMAPSLYTRVISLMKLLLIC